MFGFALFLCKKYIVIMRKIATIIPITIRTIIPGFISSEGVME
jgi:hypothetical protein